MPEMKKWYLLLLVLALIAVGVFSVWLLASSRMSQPDNAELVRGESDGILRKVEMASELSAVPGWIGNALEDISAADGTDDAASGGYEG